MSCLDDVRKHFPFPLTPPMLEIADRLCKSGFFYLEVVTLLFEMFLARSTSSEAATRQRNLASALMNSRADSNSLLKIIQVFEAEQKQRFGPVTWKDIMAWLVGVQPVSDGLYLFLYDQFRNGMLQNNEEFDRCVRTFNADPSVSRAYLAHGR
ncbi:hypothetical protein D7U98_03830 [Stenotrophomonas maltophilia]|uniref:Uncharacterized protein n=1 Tax=Stenotrophomonas bentonitica TaxID=1450134 RepID=A0ABU9JR48_9GAMM|nr:MULTISPECIES: hypothetical protein [Stenotrophomonas]MBA0394536.1 hypothetical protein [Stenotrophomonas maltophilia]PKH69564.1 hypothetical protein CXF90_18660 [Stenotrophomonas sp. Betaine-02u-23]PKH74670.1 hypothetical protein CXF96_07620 [Stenotrophomonas sp. Betaine-02u-21]PKH95571.1 hypothetical protein CXG43_12795 [Stenotrophomonas sp. Bg11-02]QGL75374.1 hypothetical protein FEO95_06910 [Stenotrophomonas maltophilia]